jgi:hypothetical protein
VYSIASNAPANVASSFLFVGERTNITGSPKFAKALKAGDWDACLAIAKQQVESGANIIDINVDEALIEGEPTMVKLLNLIAAEPDICRVPVMVDSSKWTVLEAGLQCLQGKGIVNSISLKDGETEFLRRAQGGVMRHLHAAQGHNLALPAQIIGHRLAGILGRLSLVQQRQEFGQIIRRQFAQTIAQRATQPPGADQLRAGAGHIGLEHLLLQHRQRRQGVAAGGVALVQHHLLALPAGENYGFGHAKVLSIGTGRSWHR